MIFNIIEPADMTYDELVFNAQLTPLPLAHLRVKLIFAQVYSVIKNYSAPFEGAFSVKISPRLGSAGHKRSPAGIKQQSHKETVDVKHPALKEAPVLNARFVICPQWHTDRHASLRAASITSPLKNIRCE